MSDNAVLYMSPVPVSGNRNEGFAYEIEVDLAAAGDSAAVIIPSGVKGLVVTLSFASSGSGEVQTTTDLVYTVKTGTPIWAIWPSGEVSSTTSKECAPVSAVKLTQIHSGTAKMTIRAQ
jgi:hypothetical protein